MKLSQVVAVLNGELLTPDSNQDADVTTVFASDMMSDVLAFTTPGMLLLTGLVNHHAVCTACLADIAAVVFVQGKRPDNRTVEHAFANKLPLIFTDLPMYETCGILWQAGLARSASPPRQIPR